MAAEQTTASAGYHTVVLTGGGVGSRMGADRPKQFLELAGKPILVHTAERWLNFLTAEVCPHAVMTLPEAWLEEADSLLQRHLPPEKMSRLHLMAGGATRTDSVAAALEWLATSDRGRSTKAVWVAVHDLVRPLFTLPMLRHAFQVAEEKGSAVCITPVTASLRRRDAQGDSQPVDRTGMVQVQTPQIFRLEGLLEAYRKRDPAGTYTDDASLMQEQGWPIHLVEGSAYNLKITTPEDLALAELIYQALGE